MFKNFNNVGPNFILKGTLHLNYIIMTVIISNPSNLLWSFIVFI